MGNTAVSAVVGYDEVQRSLVDHNVVKISTMPNDRQNCLIKGTTGASIEEDVINKLLKSNTSSRIIVYGLNCTDNTPMIKKKQLVSLGFKNVNVYPGGLFEWLLLQEVFGREAFPTRGSDLDIIKYGPGTRDALALTNGV